MGVLKDKLNNTEDWDVWESEYEEKRHEAISNLQIATLNELFGDLEDGIADAIINSVINAVDEQDDADIIFFQEVKYALREFIIVDKYSDEDKKCVEKMKEGELRRYDFKGHEWSNYALYYII